MQEAVEERPLPGEEERRAPIVSLRLSIRGGAVPLPYLIMFDLEHPHNSGVYACIVGGALSTCVVNIRHLSLRLRGPLCHL